MFTAFFYFAIK